MKKFYVLATLLVVMLNFSCQKEVSEQENQIPKELDQSKIYKLPTTAEEKILVGNLVKVTDIFKELYKDKSNVNLVNAAIFSKAYTDQSVLLKDLIYPDQSRLNAIPKFKNYVSKFNVSLKQFSTNFWNEVEKNSDPSFKEFLNSLNAVSLSKDVGTEEYDGNGDGVSVYFPYMEEFIEQSDDGGGGYYEPIASIATATADADEGWGQQPYFINGVFQYYTQVLVNDEYAETNPTHIIGVNGIEITTDSDDPPPPPPPPPGVSRVFIGEAICLENYDRLISFTGNGGGSEIKYCRLSGYLQPVNGQVNSFQDIFSVDFSRRTIRKEKWIRVFGVWDDDWASADLEQVLAIYEEDTEVTKTFNGSLGTTLSLGGSNSGSTVTGSIGFSVSVKSQDDIIRQLKISRNSYFSGALQNQGQDFSPDVTFLPASATHGWPAYDVHYWNKSGAIVGWTWPYSTF